MQCYELTNEELQTYVNQGYTIKGGPFANPIVCLGGCAGAYHHWPMNDGEDLTVIDIIAGLNGQLNSGLYWSSSTPDGSPFCLEFATNGLMSIPDSQVFGDLKSFTIATWVKPDITNGGNCTLLGCSNGEGWSFGVDASNQLYFGRTLFSPSGFVDPNNDCVFGGTVLTPGVWHHVGVSVDGLGGVEFYMNDVSDGIFGGQNWAYGWNSGSATYYVQHANPNGQDDLILYIGVVN